MSINYESNYLLPNISDQLCAYQKDRVSQMIRDFIETNRQMNQFHFEYCPKCGQFHPVLVKAGKTKAGKQMLKCSSCHKRFVCDHGQLIYYSHQPQSKWNDLIIKTQKGNSFLHTTAKIKSLHLYRVAVQTIMDLCAVNTGWLIFFGFEYPWMRDEP